MQKTTHQAELAETEGFQPTVNPRAVLVVITVVMAQKMQI